MTDEREPHRAASEASRPYEVAIREVWSRARAYLDGGEAEKQELTDAVQRLVSEDLSNPAMYAAKLTTNGYRNQVWQGRGNTEANDVMVLLDQSNNQPGVETAALDRLNPPADNGFDAIVIGRHSNAGWTAHAVVEYEHSDIGARLSAELPDVQLIRVPDPGAAPTTWLGGSALDPEDDLGPEEVLLHLDEAKNVVLEGPPGTGKTRLALQVASQLAGGATEECRLEVLIAGAGIDERQAELQAAALVWEVVQLHPGFSYEDFVRGQRTDPEAEGFALKTVDGILPRMCRVAELREDKPTLLIIDELNRANLSSVLGETIFAIDPAFRNRSVSLQYDAPGGESSGLRVPANLFILGTMNTADRSIAMLDYAIRRRFRFLYMIPSRAAVDAHYQANPIRLAFALGLFDAFSGAVSDPDLRIGHSYVMVDGHEALTDTEWAHVLVAKVLYEIRPLLREYSEEGQLLNPALLGIAETTLDLIHETDEALGAALLQWLLPELAPE